jgi:hypothetical protein
MHQSVNSRASWSVLTMKDIKGLSFILREKLSLNKCRVDCLTGMIMALMVVRTINLQILSKAIKSGTLAESCVRRLQRFFVEAKIDFDQLAKVLVGLILPSTSDFEITIDRTNWQFGKKNLNILMLGVVYQGAAIPVMWVLLNKKGNSNTDERIKLMKRFIDVFGKDCIKVVLADREFVGKKWFSYLKDEQIQFLIRIKENTKVSNTRVQGSNVKKLFSNLGVGMQQRLEGTRKIWGLKVYLTALRLETGELLAVASAHDFKEAIELYGKRWEIESLFQSFKGRGFNFEDTHITEIERINRIVAVLSLAFVWALKVGEWCNDNVKKLKIKKHGRLERSLFRYGLDVLNQAILETGFEHLWNSFLKLLSSKQYKLAEII